MTTRRARIAAWCTFISLVVGGDPLFAGKHKDDGKTADEIVAKMIDTDPLGYGGAEATIAMALVNDRAQENHRTLAMKSRKDDDTRRLFVRFTDPADVAGTSFLGIDDGETRTQFLYLPAVGKPRRISGTQRNASFVGTDYTYADLDLRDIDDSSKTRLADEKVGGQDCWVVEVVPSASDSDYGKVDLWIAKESALPLRIRFYDADGNERKRMTVSDVKKVEGRWVITASKLVDLKRQHTTEMKVTDIDLRDDIPLEQFEERALERE